jgi:hypothetical protein
MLGAMFRTMLGPRMLKPEGFAPAAVPARVRIGEQRQQAIDIGETTTLVASFARDFVFRHI